MEVRRIGASIGAFGENPKPFGPEAFKLKREPQSTPEKKKVPGVTASQMAEMRWFAMVGKPTIRNRDGTFTLPDGRVVTEEYLNKHGTSSKK